MNTIWITAAIAIVIAVLGIVGAVSSAMQAVNEAEETARNEKSRADEAADLLDKTNETLGNTKSSIERMSLLLTKTDLSLEKADENIINSQRMLEQQNEVIDKQGELLEGYKSLLKRQEETIAYMSGIDALPSVVLSIIPNRLKFHSFNFTLNNETKNPVYHLHYNIKQFNDQLGTDYSYSRHYDEATFAEWVSKVRNPIGTFPILIPDASILVFQAVVFDERGAETFEIKLNWLYGTYTIYVRFKLDELGNTKLAHCRIEGTIHGKSFHEYDNFDRFLKINIVARNEMPTDSGTDIKPAE